MNFPRLFIITFLISVSFISVFTQEKATESDTEKTEAREALEKKALKLVDQTVGEAISLKLWENRALTFAMAGDLIWKTNQKRARALFRDSADELIQGAIQPKAKAKSYFDDYNFWQQRSPRRVILLLIASHDADLALTLLQETRPASLQRAIDEKDLQKVRGQKSTQVQRQKDQSNRFKVNQELSLEQQFAVKAAEQDPNKAAKLIRESLKKGVSMSAITLVKKINKKDEDLGKELLGEIIDKLLETKYPNAQSGEFQTAFFLLDQSANAKNYKSRDPKFEQVKVEESDLKSLANKLADYYLVSKKPNDFWRFSDLIPIVKKYAPSKMVSLKKKEKEMLALMSDSMRSFQESNKKLSDPNITAEELIAEAGNQLAWQKYQFYRKAVDKFIEKGDTDKARQLLNSEPESKQKTDALNYLTSKLSKSAIDKDKLEDAQQLIEQAETNSSKVTLLVDLAIGFEKKNTEESHKTAVTLIEEATELVNNIPESRAEANDILKVISGLAHIKPERSYSYLTNLIYMSNDLMTAQSLIAKYNKRSVSIKNGEVIFTQMFNNSYSKYGAALGKLAEHDFGKTESTVIQFQRQDIQILCKMILAQSILKKKIGLEGNRVTNITYSF